MTIGDDGVASICLGIEHIGNPCERCGHGTEEYCTYCCTDHIPNDGSCERERLKRRREFMPDYDKKLEEWLS